MRFSSTGAMALAAAVANASPVTKEVSERHLLGGLIGSDSSAVEVNLPIDQDLSGKILVVGALVNEVVDPLLGVAADVNVDITCVDCYTRGNIDAKIDLENVVPAISLSLNNVAAKLDLDISIDAAATIAVNLFVSPDPLDLSILGIGLDAKVMLYLDLVLGVETALEASAGLEVTLGDKAGLDLNLMSGDIINAAFGGVGVDLLPVEVTIGCTQVLAALRLRAEVAAGVSVDAGDILPILDVIPDIQAGVEVGAYVNLFELIALFCDADDTCPVSDEKYGLTVGVEVELGVDVEDIIDLDLAPTVSVKLLDGPIGTQCPNGPPTTTSTPPVVTPPGSTYPPSTTAPPMTTYPPHGGSSSDYVTSTVTATSSFVVTKCGVNVCNCPKDQQTPVTVVHTTEYATVCPGNETPTGYPSVKPTHTDDTVTKVKHVTMTTCPAETSTYSPPASTPYPSASTTQVYPSASTTTATIPTTHYPEETPSTSTTYTHVKPTTYPGASESETKPVGTPTESVTYPQVPTTYPGTTESQTYPVGTPSESTTCTESATLPVGTPTGSYPGEVPSGSTTYPGVPTTEYPGQPTGGYPGNGPSDSVTYPVGTPTETVTLPVGTPTGYPEQPTGSYPGGNYPGETPSESMTYPIETPTGTYPGGNYPGETPSESMTYPVETPTGSYPGGNYPGETPSESMTYPIQAPTGSVPYPTGPAGGYPSGPAVPTGSVYPTPPVGGPVPSGPAGGYPSGYPSVGPSGTPPSSYPTGVPPTGAAGKTVAVSGAAAVLALLALI